MIKAYHLYTGADGDSHVTYGSVSGNELVEAESILFKETAAHSSFDWHNDPIPQYVITLSVVLEFTTKGGETFTLHPGEFLIATDHTGHWSQMAFGSTMNHGSEPKLSSKKERTLALCGHARQ